MPPNSDANEIVLSLISHTNVGKTALARTLLRRDVGEVADSAHVTVVPESYPLIESGGYSARLWDTPGFGSNLAKLAKRLRSNNNPVGWLLHQVWDRTQDKSLWCSQEAIRNVQEDTDIVLYLVDASQPPETLGYVDLELEVIEWIGKPVLVFLNQTGQPEIQRDRLAEAEWKAHLSKRPVVKNVSILDAFTRCWTQEHHILSLAAETLDKEKAKAARHLSKAWMRKNLDVFDKAVETISELLVSSVLDTEALSSQNLFDKVRTLILKKERSRELDRIQTAMYDRLANRTADTVNYLISLYGLDGQSASRLAQTSREEFFVKRDLEESFAATIGGALSGLVGGLSADLISGGMTFGGGAIVGMLLGGTTTYALAKGYNLTQTGQNMVRWTESHFQGQLKFIVMLYLAVSHFGRGRGSWKDPVNNPAHWEAVVDGTLTEMNDDWKKIWKRGGASADPEKVAAPLRKTLRRLLLRVFEELYPDSSEIFELR